MLRNLLDRLNAFGRAKAARPASAGSAADESDRLIEQGDQAEKTGNMVEACERYREAVEVAPAYARARLNLGVALEATGDIEGAVECYEAALALDPANAYASYNLGKLLYSQGALLRAEELLRSALTHKPEFPEAQVVLASVYEAQGRLDAAAAALENALRQRPDWAGAVGGPVQARVVQQHRDPVPGDPHVGLQVAEAQCDDAVDRGEGVLQSRCGAAVRECDRPAGVEERESRRHGRQHARP